MRPGKYLLHLWKRGFSYHSLPSLTMYWVLGLDTKGKGMTGPLPSGQPNSPSSPHPPLQTFLIYPPG